MRKMTENHWFYGKTDRAGRLSTVRLTGRIALLSAVFLALSFSAACAPSTAGGGLNEGETLPPQSGNSEELIVSAAGREFVLRLEANGAVRALAELLPLTLEMSAMPHEKYCYLSQELPVSTESPGTIAAGDVMLWGNSCLVIFYESFQTSYSYTRIGRIVDTDGLADALGQGGVTVTLRKAG